MRVFGIDVAREGTNRSVCVVREDNRVLLIEDWTKADITQSADRVERLFRRYGADQIIIDCDGLGAGVHDILRQRNLPVMAFHGQARTDRKDDTGELGFTNMRSCAWWNLRQLLAPHKGHNLILPAVHDGLTGDLTCPRWDVINQRVVVESKDQIQKRLHRSPDFGDALAYAFCPTEPGIFEENFRVFTSAQVESLSRQEQTVESRHEDLQIDALLWQGAYQNFDVFNEF